MTANDLTLIGGTQTPEDAVFQARHLIDGEWRESSSGEVFERRSPAHATLVSVACKGAQSETAAAIEAARRVFDAGEWSGSSGKDRATLLLRVADLIDSNRTRIARIEVMETGKPITQALGEIEGSADLWRYAASLARTVHGDSYDSLGPDMLGLVIKQPIGVVAIITPWNFPFLILSQKLPFALAAGCTCVLKPSELTPSSATILGEILIEAGLGAGVVNIVHGFGQPVGALMSTHDDVDMVSFTGSTAVGKAITRAASDSLKRVASELGGKNPQVLFADADVDSAIDAIVFGVYFNAGECCNSGSRIIVHQDIAADVVSRVVELSKKVAFGDPLDPATKVGAIISSRHQDKIERYVREAEKAGAKIEMGGSRLEIKGLAGAFYHPTVVSGVTPQMAIAREEVFGPVLAVLTFSTMKEAISLVNSASYGLSAGVWSESIHTCLEFARKVQAGTVWTNTWMDGFGELPFGGVKQSGQGRELGRHALEEFMEIKTVQMRIGKTRSNWV